MDSNYAMDGLAALQWAREISKLPEGHFTVCFYPYSRTKGMASSTMVIKENCKYRKQLPNEKYQVGSENYFLFTDGDGEPRMCYRILIRYMGFPNDNYKLHKINWL